MSKRQSFSFRKLLQHKDKNKIVKKLTEGVSVREVHDWLKRKYPSDKKMHISIHMLQGFRREKLQIDKEVLTEIRNMGKELNQEKEENAMLAKIPAYKEKIKEAVQYHVDFQQELKENLVLIKSRIEEFYNKASLGELTINEERNFLAYLESHRSLLDKWIKYVDRIAEPGQQQTINVNVIQNQAALIRDVIMEILSEMDPILSVKFLDKFNQKMNNISFGEKKDPLNAIMDVQEALPPVMEEE